MGVFRHLIDSTILKFRNSILSPKTILAILLTYCFGYRTKTVQSSEITVSQYKFAYSVQTKKLFIYLYLCIYLSQIVLVHG